MRGVLSKMYLLPSFIEVVLEEMSYSSINMTNLDPTCLYIVIIILFT